MVVCKMQITRSFVRLSVSFESQPQLAKEHRKRKEEEHQARGYWIWLFVWKKFEMCALSGMDGIDPFDDDCIDKINTVFMAVMTWTHRYFSQASISSSSNLFKRRVTNDDSPIVIINSQTLFWTGPTIKSASIPRKALKYYTQKQIRNSIGINIRLASPNEPSRTLYSLHKFLNYNSFIHRFFNCYFSAHSLSSFNWIYSFGSMWNLFRFKNEPELYTHWFLTWWANCVDSKINILKSLNYCSANWVLNHCWTRGVMKFSWKADQFSDIDVFHGNAERASLVATWSQWIATVAC